MNIEIGKLIGEATAYEKKEQVEAKRPKSWLKSVAAFANGEGGLLIFGMADDGSIVGLPDAERDGEIISENIKNKLDPVPNVQLDYKDVNGVKLILLHVDAGDETPYYYIGDASGFHVTLWNLNYGEFPKEEKGFPKEGREFLKGEKEFLKKGGAFLKKRKEFLKAQREIYKIILLNPHTTIAQMAVKMSLSDRQVRKYLHRLAEMGMIVREGGRKIGSWRIVDKDYEGFYDKNNGGEQ